MLIVALTLLSLTAGAADDGSRSFTSPAVTPTIQTSDQQPQQSAPAGNDAPADAKKPPTRRIRGSTARGESQAAFDGRCILAGCVTPPSNIPDILGRRALGARRLARLGATPDVLHGLLRRWSAVWSKMFGTCRRSRMGTWCSWVVVSPSEHTRLTRRSTNICSVITHSSISERRRVRCRRRDNRRANGDAARIWTSVSVPGGMAIVAMRTP
jgi:hypothetical protein